MRGDSASTSDSDANGARKALHYLPWYTGDFMSATRGWSVTARGVYRELLDAQWDRGALPADGAELKRLIGATTAEWRCWATYVENKFPVCADGLRRNARLEQHRQKSIGISQIRAAIGRQGGAASAARRRGVVTPIGGANGA